MLLILLVLFTAAIIDASLSLLLHSNWRRFLLYNRSSSSAPLFFILKIAAAATSLIDSRSLALAEYCYVISSMKNILLPSKTLLHQASRNKHGCRLGDSGRGVSPLARDGLHYHRHMLAQQGENEA